MTLLGILVLVVVVGGWLYAGIRLVPKYLEYMRIASTLEKVRDEYDSNPGSTEFMLRKAIERHFDIEMVNIITANDIEITKSGSEFTIQAYYDDTVHLAGNVSFLVEFDKSVVVNAR
jgi:hypothetical protein